VGEHDDAVSAVVEGDSEGEWNALESRGTRMQLGFGYGKHNL
jgi:hypothetical protein